MRHRCPVTLRHLAAVLAVAVIAAACASGEDDDDELVIQNTAATAGRCGVARWSIKTGTDAQAGQVDLVPRDTTLALLGALPQPSSLPSTTRIAPTELQIVRLSNVTLVQYKLEADSDYHLVLNDGTSRLIAEIPDPACVSGGPFKAGITAARAAFDAKFQAAPTWQTANVPVTLVGISFFDDPHSQSGAAPNAIEVHPVTSICFGKDCAGPTTPDFSLAASPATVTSGGAQVTSTISVTSTGGFARSVALAAAGLPTGATARLSPNPVPAGGSAVLTLNPGSATAGTYSLTISGTSGTLTRATLLTWTIGLAVGPDFVVVPTPAAVASSAGAPALASLAIQPLRGFVGTVALAVTGAPAGAQARLSASSVTNGATSVLTLQPGTAAPGSYALTITGTSGALARPTQISWDVSGASGDTPPVAQITSPASGATVSGTITVVSRASDADGISRVEFYLDGALAGSGAVSPFSFAWDTAAVSNGGHTLLVKAYDPSGDVGSAAIVVTVANGAPPPRDLVQNGGFEGTLTGWTLGGAKAPIDSTLHPHTGTYALRLGATTSSEPLGDSWAYQEEAIPADATQATLSFWSYRSSADSGGHDWQEARILDASGATLQTLFHGADDSRTWTRQTADLTAYRGQTVRLYFNVHSNGGTTPTSLWIDDVTLLVASGAGPPPPPPDVPDAPPAPPPGPPDAPLPGGPSIQTIFVIVLENRNWSSIKGSSSAPYLNGTLLPMASHAEAYYNPPGNHPSEPNYLWLVGGTNFGVTDDKDPATNHLASHAHLGALLQAAGLSWRSYQEDIGGTSCPLTAVASFAPKHDPFLFFDDLTGGESVGDPTCIAHNRPYSELAGDLASGAAARFNFITPDLCHDMHNSCAPTSDPIRQGDSWLASEVPKILASPAYRSGGALFIVWDEAASGDGPIGLLVLSSFAKGKGYANSVHYTHSSLLRTFQEILGLSPLLGDAANATSLGDLFNTYP